MFCTEIFEFKSGKDWFRVLKSGVLPAESSHVAGAFADVAL
jgi:hypothetical protein